MLADVFRFADATPLFPSTPVYVQNRTASSALDSDDGNESLSEKARFHKSPTALILIPSEQRPCMYEIESGHGLTHRHALLNPKLRQLGTSLAIIMAA